jgi:hypothetical protein
VTIVSFSAMRGQPPCQCRTLLLGVLRLVARRNGCLILCVSDAVQFVCTTAGRHPGAAEPAVQGVAGGGQGRAAPDGQQQAYATGAAGRGGACRCTGCFQTLMKPDVDISWKRISRSRAGAISNLASAKLIFVVTCKAAQPLYMEVIVCRRRSFGTCHHGSSHIPTSCTPALASGIQ